MTHLHHPSYDIVLVFDVREFVGYAVSVGRRERQVLLVRLNVALAAQGESMYIVDMITDQSIQCL